MKKIILISILTAISAHVCAQAWNPEKAALYAKLGVMEEILYIKIIQTKVETVQILYPNV